ncbi:MAG: sulfatase [Gammaproteobacteria bacterium]|nr:sulfatase [Gammaproteobacteria bacterium]NCW56777.1 sulfatase [Gammaproteobacteria bacterium]
MNKNILKISAVVMVTIATLAVGVQLLGGWTGLALLYVRHIMSNESAPFREVSWQQGPSARASPAGPTASQRPNVLLIVVDDLGYADLSAFGGGVAEGRVPTPNIDGLAQRGVSFEAAYSGNPTCAPSRAAIMTGRYPTRFGFEFTPTPSLFMKLIARAGERQGGAAPPVYFADREAGQPAYEDMGLPTSEVTIAKVLQSAGYHTAHIGKWHLGDSPKFRSYAHGFDESLSLQHGASMYLPSADPRVVTVEPEHNIIDKFILANQPWGVRFNDGEVFKPDRYLTDYFTDQAIRVIDANQHRPFFLYLAYNAPHTPLQATREDYDALPFIKDHDLRVYAAMLRSLDRNVGRVLAALRERGLEDNTLVIFTSDNGAPHYTGLGARNAPLRGWKATYFEGGIRVPLFLQWPAALPQNARRAGPAAHFDIFSTIVAATGAVPPTDRVIDGVDLLPYARGEVAGRPHDSLFWRTDRYLTLLDGDWKLQLTEMPRKAWLYNLAQDPGEKNNLATNDAARVSAMRSRLMAFDREQAAPIWQSLAAVAVPLDRTVAELPRAGEEYVYFSN